MRIRFSWLTALMAGCCFVVSGSAIAQSYTYSVYVDSDNDASTGCTENGFSGAEARLQVLVTASGPAISTATQASCSGSAFGASAPLSGGAALGFDSGLSGADVIELAADESALQVGSAPLRVGAAAVSPSGSDQLYTDGTGGPVVIVVGAGGGAIPTPLLGLPMLALLVLLLLVIGARKARRWKLVALLATLSGVTWAAQFVVDGFTADWNGVPPLATDPAGDATSGETAIDLRALFGAIENHRVFFRLDLTDLESAPTGGPTANPVTATTLEDNTVTLTLGGSDPQGGTLTFAVATAPLHGTLGPLTPTGPDSATVLYTPTADANGSDGFTYTVTNAQSTSAPASAGITITPVNDAPQFTAQNPPPVAENAGPQTATIATAIAAGPATATDESSQALDFVVVANDNPTLLAGTPTISAAGVLSYQPALDANGTAILTLVLHDDGGTADGGVDTSAAQSITITVNAVDNTPVLTAGGTLAYTENDPASAIDASITISDVDSTTLTGATVRISTGYQNGADVLAFADTATISASFDAVTGALSLVGVDTLANYQAALRAVTYVNTSDDPDTTARTVTWQANDGTGNSAPVTSTITVTAVDDPATITAGGTLAYSEGDPATPVDVGITVTDPDDTDLVGASVQIAANYVNGEDVLAFAPAGGITGTFDAASGTLTLNGTASLAAYESALRAVTYVNMSANPSPAPRTVAWQVNDGSSPSNIATSTITVTGVDTAPVVTAGGTLAYTEGNPSTPIDGGVTVTDPDSATLAGASAQISANYQNGADVLAFVDTATITGTWDAASGTLTLSGADTVAAYQAALRAVTFANTSTSPSTAPRTVFFVANDGASNSAPAASTITVTAVDDPPVLTGGATVTYTEDDPPLVIDASLAASDLDDTTLAGATVQISANYVVGEDVLDFTPSGAITGSFLPATGVLTLSGTDTLAAYEAALHSVTYRNTSQNPGTATRTASFQVSDGAASSNIVDSTIGVTPVNDAPVVVAGASVSYTEGDAAVVADATLGVTDADSTTLTGATVQITANFDAAQDELAVTPTGAVTGVYDNVTGTLTLSGTDTPANYEAALRSVTYRNASQNPSVGVRTLSWGASDGAATSAIATSTVSVISINSAPVFTVGADQTALEDAGAQTVAAWATGIGDGDGGGQTLTFEVTGNTNPSLFSTAPAVSATGDLTFTSATDANGTATITLVLHDNGGTTNGGVDTSAPQTFTITVTAVNDAPAFTRGADPSVLENAGAQSIANWATAISAGSPDESAQTLTFEVTGNDNAALFSVVPAVASNGTLTFTPATNASGVATITLVLHDDGGTANGGVDTSAAQTFTITVSDVNEAPSFTKGADPTVNEDAGVQTIANWATAISQGAGDTGQTLDFIVTGNTNPALFSAAPAVSPTGTLTFTPAADANGTATITLVLHDDGGTANGGVDTSAPQTFTIAVNAVNDAPSFTRGADPTVLEDSGPQILANWASAISPGPANESSQTTTFQIVGNTAPGLFSAGPAVSPTGTLSFTPAADANGSATITLRLSDDGGTANGGVDNVDQAFTINITPVNDAPSFVGGADEDVFDDAGAITRTGWATSVSPGPANESGQAVSFAIDANDDPGAFATGPTIAADGTLSYTPAQQNAAGDRTAHITVSVHDNGGTANGGVDASAGQSFTIRITHRNRPPTLTNPVITYNALGNTQLQAGGAAFAGLVRITDASGALAKAVAVDTDGPSPPATVAASGTSANGGDFSIAADGAFTYVPAPGFAGTDTFTYQVSDGLDTTNGTVSVTVAGPKVWYVSNLNDTDNPVGGDGRSNNAFDTLAGAQSASANGDIIFVFRGDSGTTPLAGGIVLKDGQKLWGEGIGLSVGSFGNLVAAGSPAVLSSGGDTVTVAASTANGARSGVEIRGLQISGTRAIAVSSANAAALGVIVSDNDLRTSAGGTGGLVVTAGSTGTQTLAIDDNTFQGAAGSAISVTRTAGTLTVTGFSDNTVTSSGASVPAILFTGPGIVFDATAGGAYNTVSGGVLSIGSSGTPVAGSGMFLSGVGGDLSFVDIDIYASSGALSVIGTGPVNVAGGTGARITVPSGVSTLSSTNGTVLNLQAMTAALPFVSVSSIGGSATTPFNVDTVNGVVSAGSTSAISGAMASAAGSLRVVNSSASVTYEGSINAASPGAGVVLAGNAGGTIALTGPLSLSTGASSAFTATGGGTVTATNVANTLVTTTATALNVVNTTIASTGLVFRSIAANGANKGIVLNNTGASGGLSVTGSGTTAGSGGTIQNIGQRGGEFITTSTLSLKNMNFTNANTIDAGGVGTCDDLTTTGCNAAIYLNGVTGAAFDRINVTGTTVEQGINGNNVSNFTLSNSVLTNCGANGGGADFPGEEGCIKMRGLSGTSSISSSELALPAGDVAEIVNTGNQSLTLNVDGSTFRDSQSSSFGNTGLQIRSEGNSTAVVNVTNSNFLRIRTVGLHATAIGTAHGDVDVSNSTFDPGSGTMIGMDLDADNTGVLVFNVQNNPRVWSRNGPAINVFGDTGASINGRIMNNPDVAVLNNSGSNVGSGIRSNINKNAVARLVVQNNVVSIGSDDSGIDLSAIGKTAANPGGATSTLDATVTNNNVTLNGPASAYGIIILGATNAGDTNALCANVTGNNVVRNPTSITSMRARVPSAAGFFRMEGYSSNPETTWNARSNTPSSSGGSEVSYGGAGTFGACTAQLPTNPPLN